MANTFLGLTGKARSGKDTVAELLVENYGFVRYGFADPLKDGVNLMFGWNDRHRDGDLKETPCNVVVTVEDVEMVLEKFYREEIHEAGYTCREAAFTWLSILDVKAKNHFIQRDKHDPEILYYHYTLSPRQAYQWFGTEWGRDIIDQDIWLNKAVKFSKNHEKVLVSDVRFKNEAMLFKNRNDELIEVMRPDIQEEVNQHSSESGIDKNFITRTIRNDGSLEDLSNLVEELVSSLELK